MNFFKKTWFIGYVILWFILVVFFFNFGEKGDLYSHAFGRASSIFISGLALLIAIKSFLVIRGKLKEGKSRLVYLVIGAIVIPLMVGVFVFGIYAAIYAYPHPNLAEFVLSQPRELQNKESTTLPPPTNTTSSTQTPISKTFSESEIVANLKTNWQAVQVSIPFRPAYHNQTEDAKKIWRNPTAVQFIGENRVLVRFEDDNNVHTAVFNFTASKFNLLEVFKNQSEFTLLDWQNLVNKYGDSSYSVSTYTTGLIRNKQIVSFSGLTKVSENILVKNYFGTQPTYVWQTYRSSYGFEIQYPQGWKIINELDAKKVSYPTTILLSVSFGTGTYGNEGYDGEWFVFVYDKSSASVEGLIKDTGKQFSDRQEKRENIIINGTPALKVVVTTPSIPSWVYEAIIVEKVNNIYLVHNGAIKNDLFDEFYSSFKLNLN